jgi:hypothetical protein
MYLFFCPLEKRGSGVRDFCRLRTFSPAFLLHSCTLPAALLPTQLSSRRSFGTLRCARLPVIRVAKNEQEYIIFDRSFGIVWYHRTMQATLSPTNRVQRNQFRSPTTPAAVSG